MKNDAIWLKVERKNVVQLEVLGENIGPDQWEMNVHV